MSDLDADHLKELEKILLDDDQVSEGQLREDVSKELKPPGKRERVRGRPSRNRRKRKRRSSESPSSSSSYSSSLDSSEDSELDSHPLLDRRLAGREEEGRRKFEPPSPLQELQEKIPKKIEFSSSIREAPEIAGLEKKKLRARRLPLVASPLATVPVLDEGLRAINYRLPLDEQAMVADSECVMNAINLLAISRNEAAEQRFERADSYVKQAMELLGISIHDFNVRRRERFFRSYGVDPLRSVPNYRRLPVEVPTRSADKPWNEFAGGLIGSKLATEIVEKTQCQRLTEALLKERKSFYQKRDRTQKRHHSRSTKKEKSRESRGAPPKLRRHNFCRGSQSAAVGEEVQKMLEKGAIEVVDWHEKIWLSSIFCIPKKDGSLRPIINLKPLNKYITHVHFKLESLEMIRDLVNPGSYLAKVDMKDAYFAIPIHNDYRNYLCFHYEDKLFRFKALPFGLSSAPYVYTRVTRHVARALRRKGLRLLVYLDDWIFIADSAKQLKQDLSCAITLFEKLGFLINYEKSQLTPSQSMEFLGITIDTVQYRFLVPPQKVSRCCQEALELVNRRIVRLRDAAEFELTTVDW
ncbi:reverse transcriptase [Cooperia oncophora]